MVVAQSRYGRAFEWLGVERAWTRTRGDAGTLVAVVETGVQCDHPLLGPGIRRDHSHPAPVSGEHELPGTQAAGLIAGRTRDDFAGIAPLTRLVPVRFGAGPGPQHLDLANAIEYAVEAGASIINIAAAADPGSPAVTRAIQYAAARNVLVVGAANHSVAALRARATDDPLPNQISVLSVDSSLVPHGSHGDSRADIAAPGFGRVPQWNGAGHVEIDGAAIGAAYVTGCAALVKAQNPGWGYHELKDHLFASAHANPRLDSRCELGRQLHIGDAVLGPIEIETDGPELEWSALNDAVIRWKLRFRSAYCANAVALYRRHGDEHWRELGFARASAEQLHIPAAVMRRSTGTLRIACRESNFHTDEVPLTIR